MKKIISSLKQTAIGLASKALLVILFLTTTQQVFAGWRNGLLRIREDRGRSISVSIDGRKYPKVARNLTVGDLPAGRHLVKIFKYNSNGHGYSNGTLIYQGDIIVKPGNIYYITAMKGNIDIEENCCIDDYGHWNNNDNWENWDESNNNWNNNRNWSRSDRNDHHDNDNWNNQGDNDWNTQNSNDDWNNKNSDNWKRNDRYDYNDPSWNGYSGGMSEGRFQQLIGQIRKTSFENTKVSVANQAIRDNKITVKQLVAILNEFGFESTKLTFAKDNYQRVIDRNNYFMVNDVFTFESSKDELNNFLSSQR